jgi:hypothetical protein
MWFKQVNNHTAHGGMRADRQGGSAFAEEKGAAKAVGIEVEVRIHSRTQEQASAEALLFGMPHLRTIFFLPCQPDTVSSILYL